MYIKYGYEITVNRQSSQTFQFVSNNSEKRKYNFSFMVKYFRVEKTQFNFPFFFYQPPDHGRISSPSSVIRIQKCPLSICIWVEMNSYQFCYLHFLDEILQKPSYSVSSVLVSFAFQGIDIVLQSTATAFFIESQFSLTFQVNIEIEGNHFEDRQYC